ncbi:quinoprotein glucose dehydrogenase [Sagittula marina]|uniref:Quinoprotein glucose dehydrogenase n=1 Tax=Sagittula marina TaxID=943940 RepID=A0A7W6DWS3_9RHOB|nr:pyrroloquinoline quinone-dependent dehydrogenase [Sagittula marina]MBB3987553.1 quinoprotein glucose dehydrogenase [Sagittula marina]
MPLLRTLLLTAALPLSAAAQTSTDWTGFHGNLAAQKFSPLTQITPENVTSLERAWELHTGDLSLGDGDLPKTIWSATPIYANETLYLGTPFYRILAIDPSTGEEKWSFDTDSTLEALTQPGLKNRGVTYWEAEEQTGRICDKAVYIGTMDARLFAVDANNGVPCEEFADGGQLDVNQWNTTNDKWPLSLLQPPTAYGDQLFVGWAGKDWEYAEAPAGTVFSIDARTGELQWTVEFIPSEIRAKTGTANIWTAMTVDEERGILYLPVSSPSPNYWGGNRTQDIPLATSVTAVDTETGEIIWSRQLVHHDIWDYDTNAAPTLVDLTVEGEKVPALVQTSKQGMLYVLNRETGEPIFDWEERVVPASTAMGEKASPTQPFVTTPEPPNASMEWPGVWGFADLMSFGYCSRKAAELDYQGLFTPPSEQGSLIWPGTAGGMQWGGGAVNPETGIYYVNTSHVVQILELFPREEYDKAAGGSANESGFYPQTGSPYGFELTQFVTPTLGIPCWKPPFGALLAYDMNTGEKLWEEPFGAVQQWGFYMPESWGSPTIGGPALTASGLLFIGASMDDRVRAIDAETGKVLWSDLLEAPVVANPAVFEHEGEQYVVFVSGGNTILKPEVSDQVVAYRLPR